MTKASTVGFIGLGNMGAPMAETLCAAGVDVVAYDVRPEAVARLVDLGGRAATSVAGLVSATDVLLTCVLYDHQVRDVFLGPGGVLENAKPGLIAAIHSTIDPNTVIEIAAAAKTVGVEIVDAPVSGASTGAAAGTLTVIAGGSAEALEVLRPVLVHVAGHVFHVGPVGTAQIAKLANNIMFLCNQVVAMEAVRFAEAFDVDRKLLFEVAAVSTGASWAASNFDHFDRYGTEHTLAGTAELPHRFGKDLRQAIAIAQSAQTYLPVAGLVSQLLPEMFAERWKQATDDQ
jgi:3-hydroxyisobutyrate dehydrogenase-like beta-hydroxyacid dehydrogenase